MPTLTLTYTQIVELVKQLPPEKQAQLCEFLLKTNWVWLSNFIKDNEALAGMAAWERGQDWDGITEDEHEELTNEPRQSAAIQQNDVVYADFSEMANDREYQKEALAICREFEKADWEALQLGESEYEKG